MGEGQTSIFKNYQAIYHTFQFIGTTQMTWEPIPDTCQQASI
jgi:hypothetical protein